MTPRMVPATSGSGVSSGSTTSAGMNGRNAGAACGSALTVAASGSSPPAAPGASLIAIGAYATMAGGPLRRDDPGASGVLRPSVHRVRHGQGERRDDGVEAVAVRKDHAVGAVHRADRGGQRTEAGVLEALAAGEDRLLAGHPRPLDPLHLAVGVGDEPLAAHQLHGVALDVGDPHAVGAEEVVLL